MSFMWGNLSWGLQTQRLCLYNARYTRFIIRSQPVNFYTSKHRTRSIIIVMTSSYSGRLLTRLSVGRSMIWWNMAVGIRFIAYIFGIVAPTFGFKIRVSKYTRTCRLVWIPEKKKNVLLSIKNNFILYIKCYISNVVFLFTFLLRHKWFRSRKHRVGHFYCRLLWREILRDQRLDASELWHRHFVGKRNINWSST